MRQDTDEGRVQRFVDLPRDRWGDDVEAGGASYLLRDARQQPVCVVAFTKKPAVYSRQPLLTAGSHEQQCSSNQQVPPPAGRDQRQERLIAVDDDISEQQRTQHRHERIDGLPRQRVAQPLADDEAEIEEAVTQDRVGERGRHGQEYQREQRHVRRRENTRGGIERVADDDSDRPRRTGRDSKDQHTNAPPICHCGRSAAMEHQQSECDRRVGDIRQEHARRRIFHSGRWPEIPHQLHTPGQVPAEHQRGGDESDGDPSRRPDPAWKDRREGEQ